MANENERNRSAHTTRSGANQRGNYSRADQRLTSRASQGDNRARTSGAPYAQQPRANVRTGSASPSQYSRASYGNASPNRNAYNRTSYNVGGSNGRGSRKKKTRAGLVVMSVVLVVLLAAVGFTGFQGYRLYQSAQHVKTQANAALADIKTIQSDLTSGKMEDAQKTAQSLSKKATAIRKETDRKLWRYAEKLPVYGDDVKIVRTLASSLEDVSVNAIEPLCNKMTGVSLKSLMGDGGSINVDMLTQLVAEMSTAAPVLQRSVDAFNKCPEPHLDQLKGIVGKAANQLEDANALFAVASKFAPLVSNVLGANGTRNYLIVAESNVEARSAGGFYGSTGMLTIDNGKISVGDFSSLNKSEYNDAYRSLGLAENYEWVELVRFPDPSLKDMGMNPDVPHVAEVFRDACDAAGYPVDGVFFVDPILIQNLVGLTGGFAASDGTWLDGSNLATYLMHDVYWDYMNDNATQDAIFAMVASDAMHHFFSSLGDLEMNSMIETLRTSSQARHLSMWFANSEEQEAIADFGCSGAVSNDPVHPVAGIYYINESWSKMEWYLRTTREITSESDNPDGSKSYGITLTLTNTISDWEVNSGNWYVTTDSTHGNHHISYQAGDMLERVVLCAPAGGHIDDVWTDGDIYGSGWGDIYGLEACRYCTHLLPGETVTFTYTITTAPEATGDLAFDVTPLVETIL